MKVKVVRSILEANDRIAEENRAFFNEKGLFVVNLMSGPGAGKTSVLVETIRRLKQKGIPVAVIEGDIEGTQDADRISALEVPVVQINTGGACHLDANMIRQALQDLELDGVKVLFIENVGNLVCPAEFYVGEDMKAMVLSITEGEDKPEKYPLMFRESSVLLLNKMDLQPYLDIDIEKLKTTVQKINPQLKVFEVSCKTGQGIDEWVEYLVGVISSQTL
ncbi:MAG: hydrogenase accessory protein HypB [Nitrospirae bacterium]|nr:MAG: hydrogenase accessory protein HypB [Nitrospirota bacterium]